MALYASEASAVAVPACLSDNNPKSDQRSPAQDLPRGEAQGARSKRSENLQRVLNLNGSGEVMRVGVPSALDDVTEYSGNVPTAKEEGKGEEENRAGLLLPSGIQVDFVGVLIVQFCLDVMYLAARQKKSALSRT